VIGTPTDTDFHVDTRKPRSFFASAGGPADKDSYITFPLKYRTSDGDVMLTQNKLYSINGSRSYGFPCLIAIHVP